MKENKDKHVVKLELTEEEFQALKEHAEKSNIPTKTYTEFVLKNILREAKRPDSLLDKLTNLKNILSRS
jgi:uncharacterized protein (DUF1778 family)